MNAAARFVYQEAITKQLIMLSFMSRRQLATIILALLTLLSALSVIYVTHNTRELRAGYEQNLKEHRRLMLQNGQLLLERGTWLEQSRIQQLAEQELGMVLPGRRSTIVVRE